jgi:hypothetical protein
LANSGSGYDAIGVIEHSVISNCASGWNMVSWNHETVCSKRFNVLKSRGTTTGYTVSCWWRRA